MSVRISSYRSASFAPGISLYIVPQKTGSQHFIEQIFDAGVHHGTDIAAIWLQQSLDEVLGTNLRTYNAKTGIFEYDGVIGSLTRQVVEQAVRQGEFVEVNNKIVDKRVALMKAHPKLKSYPGWIPRAESFRIKVSIP